MISSSVELSIRNNVSTFYYFHYCVYLYRSACTGFRGNLSTIHTCKLGSREMPSFPLLSFLFLSFIGFLSGISLKAVDLLKMYYVKSEIKEIRMFSAFRKTK